MNHITGKTLPTTMDEFWKLTSAARSTTKHLLDKDVQSIERASIDRLRSILIQYRWFTSYYSGDLAILVYKLPPSSLRSLFASFLNEEHGMGNSADTHPAMYDRFLIGLGVAPAQLERDINPTNLALLDDFRAKLLKGDYMYGVGLRGMGAECLCQVYLEAVHHYLMKNPEIIERKKDLDWTFWDIHASEADQMHGDMTRDFMIRLASPQNIPSLSAGYLEAEKMFMDFWSNAYHGEAARRDDTTNPTLPPLDGWHYDPAR
jgi:hypothetical protein